VPPLVEPTITPLVSLMDQFRFFGKRGCAFGLFVSKVCLKGAAMTLLVMILLEPCDWLVVVGNVTNSVG